MADGFESTAELRPHISILPEVGTEVLVDLKNETEYPIEESLSHIADEQPVLFRQLLVKANHAANASLDPRQAFLFGAMYTHEAIHEQAIRNTARSLEEFNSTADEVEPIEESRVGRFKAIKLGLAIMVMAWRQKVRSEIKDL